MQKIDKSFLFSINKVDSKRKVHPQEGRELAANLKCPYVETSSKKNLDLEYAIRTLRERIYIQQLFEKASITSIYRDSFGMMRDFLDQNEILLKNMKFQLSNSIIFESKILEVREMKSLTYDFETIVLTNTGPNDMHFEFRFKPNPKFELKIKPSSGKIKKVNFFQKKILFKPFKQFFLKKNRTTKSKLNFKFESFALQKFINYLN